MTRKRGPDLEARLRDRHPALPGGSARGLAAVAAAALVAGALLLIVVGSWSGAPGAAPRDSASPAASGAVESPSAISRADAVAAVEKFIGRKLGPVDFNPTVDDPTGQSLSIVETGPAGVYAFVDMTTGRVTSLLMPAPETTNIVLSMDEAQAAAAAFLTAHAIPFEGLTAAVTIEDHGCCKFYVVTWQRHVNGVPVPDSRVVGMDPSTGAVFEFMDTRKPYGPVASPQIGRDEAIRLASIATGFSNPIVTGSELLVDAGPYFPGRLVWSIKLDDGAGASAWHAWVYVDAITGEAKVVGRG